MSTRAQISFNSGGQRSALIYRHSDGYPEGLGQDLLTFFKEVAGQTSDTRFTDPEYLAAKWVVFDSTSGGTLNFLGVGICVDLHDDIDYLYNVDCDGGHPTPTVWYEDGGAKIYLNNPPKPVRVTTKQPTISFNYKGSKRTLINYEVDRDKGLISGLEIDSGQFKHFKSEKATFVTFETKLV